MMNQTISSRLRAEVVQHSPEFRPTTSGPCKCSTCALLIEAADAYDALLLEWARVVEAIEAVMDVLNESKDLKIALEKLERLRGGDDRP